MRLHAHTVQSMSVGFAASLLLAYGNVHAGNDFTGALTGGEPWLDLRYRYENVDQDNALRDADASTARLRLGYRTGEFRDLSALVEFSTTQTIGEAKYAPEQAGYSTVADPKTSRFNQYHIDYTGLADTTLRAGRQRIKLDNDRFIGNVGFRQQEQTYDGLRVINKSLPDTTINYALVWGVNRIFHDTHDSGVEHHLVNVNYAGLPFGSLVGYGYFLDYEDKAPQSSTRTLGLRFAGSTDFDGNTFLYALEYANQRDYKKFSGSYDADYWLVELGANVAGVTVKVGQEVLGSDSGNKGFETRLATLHAHNGWADQFLATPADGLQDRYISVGGKVAGTSLLAVYHDYESDRGSTGYGTEWGVRARRAFGDNYALELKYADYDANNHGVDTKKLWLTGEMRF